MLQVARILGKRSGLSEKVTAISKRKTNLRMRVYKQRRGPQTQLPYPNNPFPSIANMSSPNEPTRRMTTRGGARDKMAKVMERVRSGGMAKGNPDQPKASKAGNTVKKSRKTKNADRMAAKKVDVVVKKDLAAKLARLEDQFLKKADISYLSHPRQWKGGVQGNATPL